MASNISQEESEQDEFLSRLNFLIKGIDQFLEPVEQLKSQPTIEATPTQPNTSPVKKLSAIKPATINLASIEKEPINLFVSAEKPTTSPSPRLVVPGNLNESPRKIRTGRSKTTSSASKSQSPTSSFEETDSLKAKATKALKRGSAERHRSRSSLGLTTDTEKSAHERAPFWRRTNSLSRLSIPENEEGGGSDIPKRKGSGERLTLRSKNSFSSSSIPPIYEKTESKDNSNGDDRDPQPRDQLVEWSELNEGVVLQGSKLLFCTISQLIRYYLECSLEKGTMDGFMLAYQQFFDQDRLLQELSTFFETISSSIGDKATDATLLRLCNFLKSWIASLKEVSQGDSAVAATLEKITGLGKRISLAHAAYGSYIIKLVSVVPARLDLDFLAMDFGDDPIEYDISHLDPKHVAQQLCLIDSKIFRAIPPTEFHSTRWTRGAAPHIERAGLFCDSLRLWFTVKILQQTTIIQRVKLLQLIIQIGTELIKLQNLNSAAAVWLSLTLPAIKGLHQSWKHTPKRMVAQFTTLQHLMSPLGNFGNYRQFLRTLHPPILPCQEVFLKDLLVLTESLPNFDSNNLVNVQKFQSMGKIISSVKSVIPHSFDQDPKLFPMIESLVDQRHTLESLADELVQKTYIIEQEQEDQL